MIEDFSKDDYDNAPDGATDTTSESRPRTTSTSEQDAHWECYGRKMNKQDTVGTVGLFVTTGAMLAYFIYSLVNYFDPTLNRKEYVKQTNVEEMPMPYIFFGFDYQQDNFTCYYTIFDDTDIIFETTLFYSTVDASFSGYFAFNDTYGVGAEPFSYILDLDEWFILHQVGTSQIQILIIPPRDATLHVNNAESGLSGSGSSGNVQDIGIGLQLYTVCGIQKSDYLVEKGNTSGEYYDESIEAIYESFLWYNIDHTDQLYDKYYDLTINETFTQLGSSTNQFILGGYVATFDYEWFDFANKVDVNKDYSHKEYFVSSVGSTFDIVNVNYNLYYDYGLFDAFFLMIKPNSAGIKITYHTDPETNWTDVLSDLGGMYGTVAGVVNFFLIYLIWGAQLKKWRFKGT